MVMVVQQQIPKLEVHQFLSAVVISLEGMTKRWFTGDAIFNRLHYPTVQL